MDHQVMGARTAAHCAARGAASGYPARCRLVYGYCVSSCGSVRACTGLRVHDHGRCLRRLCRALVVSCVHRVDDAICGAWSANGCSALFGYWDLLDHVSSGVGSKHVPSSGHCGCCTSAGVCVGCWKGQCCRRMECRQRRQANGASYTYYPVCAISAIATIVQHDLVLNNSSCVLCCAALCCCVLRCGQFCCAAGWLSGLLSTRHRMLPSSQIS